MKILALESSAKAASCAVLADGVPVASAWQCTGLTHSRTLLPMVEDMLHSSDLTLQDLDAVAVAAGPGSFTGLRIGISAVKGLAWAADKPCMGVSTLEAMAWPLAHLEGVLFCAMDARRQQIYNAVFRGGDGGPIRLREDRAISLEAAAADLAALEGPLTLVGDGAHLVQAALEGAGLPFVLMPPHLRYQTAWGVARAALEMARAGRLVSAADMAPSYHRLSQAERELLSAREQAAKT